MTARPRHSQPEPTANIYTDRKLLDVAGAIKALPALTLPPPSGTAYAAAGSVAAPAVATADGQTRPVRRRATF